jgi:2'-5' RNA ligase
VRLFVALDLSESIRSKLKGYLAQMQPVLGTRSIKWVAPENVHLTMKFLGETNPSRLQEVKDALKDVTSTTPAFSIEVGQFDCFPNRRRPRVLWVGVQEAGSALTKLHADLNNAYRRLNYEPDDRAFHPHLTIGRVHRKISRREVEELSRKLNQIQVPDLGRQEVHEIVLYKSDLRPEGPIYTALDSCLFAR